LKTLEIPWFYANSTRRIVRKCFPATPPHFANLRQDGNRLATVLATASGFLTISGMRSRIATGPPARGVAQSCPWLRKRRCPPKLAPGIPDHAVKQEVLMRHFSPPIGMTTFYIFVLSYRAGNQDYPGRRA